MTTTFTAEQLETLRTTYATLETVSTSRLSDFHRLFDGCTDAGLQQLAAGRIKFVSKLALNACTRRGLNGCL